MQLAALRPSNQLARQTTTRATQPEPEVTDDYQPSTEVPGWKKGVNSLAWAVAGGAVVGAVVGSMASGRGYGAFSPFPITLALAAGGLGAWGGTVVSSKIILDGPKNGFERTVNSAVWSVAGALMVGAAAGLATATYGGFRLFSPFSVTAALAGGGLGAWGGSEVGTRLYGDVPEA